MFPSGYTVDTEVEGSGASVFAKCVVQPWENLQYYVMGGVGHYDLSVPSLTVVNTLSGDRPGVTYGGGVKWLITPDTVVSPAVGADLSFSRSEFYLNELAKPGVGGETVSQRLTLSRIQLAVFASHKFGVVQPYGGLRWSRTNASLKDLYSGGKIGGMKDSTSPFAGVEIHAFKHESLVTEVSFIHGIQFGTGLSLHF